VTPEAAALTDLERDALTELVNIGVSRAAAALRKMIGEQVLLSVPAVEAMDRAAAATLIGERESDHLVAVKQDFSGALSGRAMLIFPQASSLALVRAVAGDAVSADEVADLEEEALAETGNVILNRCLGTMANMLHRSLALSLPEVLRGDGAHLFRFDAPQPDDGLVLFLYINFFVKNRNIRGYIAMLLDLPSLAALKALVAEFIQTALGEAEPSAPLDKTFQAGTFEAGALQE
jgi:chemotaxis protein CheC